MPTPRAVPDTYTPCDNPRGYKWKRKQCRCVACRDAMEREWQRWIRRKIQGQVDPLVPSGPAMDAVRRLTNKRRVHRLTMEAVARYAGVTSETLWSSMRGNHPAIKASTERRILELAQMRPTDRRWPTDGRRVNMVSTERAIRIIQGLMFQGYSGTWIAEQTRNQQGQISAWLTGKHALITRANDQKLYDLAMSVGIKPGPSTRIRSIARGRGYKALAEWDDLV